MPVKVNGRTRLITTKEMRAWKKEAAAILKYESPIDTLLGYRLRIEVWWPDRRRRDLDGPVKVVIDALVSAKILKDDSFIRFFEVEDMTTQNYGDDIVPGVDVRVDTVERYMEPF